MQISQHVSGNVAQPEHYLAILRIVSVLNWIGLAALLLVVGLLDDAPAVALNDFASGGVFWLLFVEAVIANSILSLALVFRGWYRRTPREELNKLRLLTGAVCLWEILHLVGLYEFFGGVFGPIAVLFPAMVLASFFILPSRSALSAAVVICVSWLVLSTLQWMQIIYPLGAVGSSILDPAGSTASRIVLMGTAMLVCLFGGALWRRQMDAALQGHYPLQLLDPRFDCFSREALYNRLRDEAERSLSSGAASCVVILSVGQIGSLVSHQGLDAAEDRLSALARAVRKITRHNLDTLAYLGDARFALLLPTLPSKAGKTVVGRIRDALPEEVNLVVEDRVVALPDSLDSPHAARHFIEQNVKARTPA